MKRKATTAGIFAISALALSACTGSGDAGGTGSATASAEQTEARTYSQDDLQALISGLQDADGNELKLYSEDQVAQGESIAKILMQTATVDPAECSDLAKAGLLDSLEEGEVAVAISESDTPTTISAQSNEQEPDAAKVLEGISSRMDSCANFTLETLGGKFEVSSEELEVETDGDADFATLSTRGADTSNMLMQVSATQGSLLVVSTKGGADLGEEDKKDLEELVNEVLAKAEDDGASGSGTESADPSPSESTEPASESPDSSPSESAEHTDDSTDHATESASPDATETP